MALNLQVESVSHLLTLGQDLEYLVVAGQQRLCGFGQILGKQREQLDDFGLDGFKNRARTRAAAPSWLERTDDSKNPRTAPVPNPPLRCRAGNKPATGTGWTRPVSPGARCLS